MSDCEWNYACWQQLAPNVSHCHSVFIAHLSVPTLVYLWVCHTMVYLWVCHTSVCCIYPLMMTATYMSVETFANNLCSVFLASDTPVTITHAACQATKVSSHFPYFLWLHKWHFSFHCNIRAWHCATCRLIWKWNFLIMPYMVMFVNVYLGTSCLLSDGLWGCGCGLLLA